MYDKQIPPSPDKYLERELGTLVRTVDPVAFPAIVYPCVSKFAASNPFEFHRTAFRCMSLFVNARQIRKLLSQSEDSLKITDENYDKLVLLNFVILFK